MPSIAVVGAGIVGICCALSLNRRGHDVLMLDRRPPASETSYGNAGIIANSEIHPLADPSLIPQIPRLLLNRDTRFQLEYAELFRLTPWLARLCSHLNVRSFTRHGGLVSGIALDAVGRHRTLMQQAGSLYLLNDTGFLKVYRREQDLAGARGLAEDYERHGIECEAVSTARIRELEPDLSREFPGGLWLRGTPSVTNPAALAKSYFDLLLREGGRFNQTSVRGLRRSGESWTLFTETGTVETERIVMAAGAWSNSLLEPLGVRLPFVQERGYHMMYTPAPGKTLQRPVSDPLAGFVLAPMESGIRVTTGANLTAAERVPNPVQLKKLRPLVHGTFPLDAEQLPEPWMGRRTSTADSLPLIGPVRHRPGLLVATGHGHLGLTLAPVTGELLADEVDGRPNPATRPFHPGRN